MLSNLVVFGAFEAFPGGSRGCRAASWEVPGGQGKLRAPDRWPESTRRSMDDPFHVEAFFCQVWSFSVFPKVYLEAEGWGVQGGQVPGHPKEEGLLDY